MTRRKILLFVIICILSCILVACKKDGVCMYCNTDGKVKKFSYVGGAEYYELCDECYGKAKKNEINLGILDIL